MNVSKQTIVTGALLVLTGVTAYLVTGTSSVTALIPAFIGVPMLICALISRRPNLYRHAIHTALVIALIGALGSLMNVVKIGQLITGTAERPAAIATSVIMFLLCVNYVAAGVYSFVEARRRRKPA